MLNGKKDSEETKHLMKKFSYKETELISSERIKVFISEKFPIKIDGHSRKSSIQTLSSAFIDDFYGIEARSFDKTIEEMNLIQESIIVGRK